MNRGLKGLWKKGMALLLAAGLILTDLTAASAAESVDPRADENAALVDLLKAVYSTWGMEGGNLSAAIAPVGTAADNGSSSWNLLSKVGRSLDAAIINPDFSDLKLSMDGRYIGVQRYEIITEPVAVKPAISVVDCVTGVTDSVYGFGQMDQPLHFDLSGDARYVAFSMAKDYHLMQPSTNVFMFDRETRNLSAITAVPGVYDSSDGANSVSISADGQYVVFDSSADGLVPGDADGIRDVFLYERGNGSLQRISSRDGMEDHERGDSKAPSISANGKYVAFQTVSQLVYDDNNGVEDIYVYDREGGNEPLQRISIDPGGLGANDRSGHPTISADGRFIAFESEADNLVANDGNGRKDIFVYDRNTKSTKLVSVGPGGIPFNRDSENPDISDDGQYVGFQLAYEWVADTDDDPNNNDENDLPEEAYVANVGAHSSERVTVPNAPYRLINPSRGPVVSRGGALVAFFSDHLLKIGDETYELPGLFLASSGEAPAWHGGSELQPSNRTTDSVTLSWPDAADAKGIRGYHVYRDDRIIGFVPYGGAGGSFTATGLLPGAEHLFQVEAVNADYQESYGGPTYKLDAGGGTPGGTLQIGWDAEKSTVIGLPMAGSKLNFFAYGNPDKLVTGELTYKTWKDNSTQETNKVPLTLTERAVSPGKYDAVWEMADNVSEITSLTIKMTDPASPGTVTERQAVDLPVQVTGTAVITFDNPGSGSLKDGILSLSSGQYGEQVTILAGEDPVTLEGLVPDKDYTIVLRSPDFRHVWAKQEQVKVGAGRKKSFPLAIEQPAKLRFQVIDQTGQPAANVQMEWFDEEQNYLGRMYTGSDGWTDWQEGLKVGTTMIAKVDIGDRMVEPVPDQRVKLIPGANEPPVIRLKAPGEGVLEGVVKAPNGSPVKNVYITATQMYRGEPIVRKTRTNLEGAYRLSLLEGEAKLELYESAYHYSAGGIVTAQIAEGETTRLDIPVRQPSTGVINLEVRLKYLEDSGFGDPVNLEQLGFHTVIESKFGHMPGGYMSGYFSNAYHFGGFPGQKVSVCVTSSKPAIMTVCDEVTLDENANATAKLYFEEKGGRIQGKLAKTDHRWINGRIYKLVGGSKTSSTYVGDDDFSGDGTFDINVPEPGTYLMELARRPVGDQIDYEYANVHFTVSDKQILPIGTVAFSGKKYFSNYAGNQYDALSSRVLPGGTVSFRAGFHNRNESEASGVSLVFDIPEGMTPVKDAGGRIVISGAATEGDARVEGQTLIVPLGTLVKKEAGTIGFQLKVDPAFKQRSVKTSAIIRAKIGTEQVEETIGSIQLDVPLVTLEVPERVFSSLVKLSGVAPSGSTVKVYDGKALIGSVSAAASGIWSLEAELDDLGDPSTHALRAETESGGVTLQSPVSYVSYDTKKPRLLEVAMAQAPDGRWVTLNTREGISRLAYSVRPGNPFQFDLKFDKPDEVENVYIYLDGQTGDPVKAVRDGNIFHAVTPTGRGALGDIYVDYDIKPEPFVNDGRYPSLEEVRQSLPPTMRDFEAEVKSPFELKNGKYSGIVQLTFPQLKDLKITVTLTIGLNSSYKATKEELELAERSGLPILNATFGATETEDGFKTVSKGHIPLNVLFPNGVPKGLTASLGAGDVQTLDADPVFTDVTTETYVQFGPGGEEFGKINGIKKQYSDTMGFAEKVMKITNRVESFGMDCLAELPKTVNQAGHALKSLVVGEVTKFGLGAWTAAMGFTGPGAIAAAGATAVAGQQIDNYVDSQIDAIGTGYNQCLDEEVDEKKLKRKKIARPRWIYDPSGYVYEAVPTNRLSGVKATVLYKDPVSQEWTVWEAGPYEQVNPHNTDDQGKYGWDVPEGKWKVVWEKEGYETKTSAELDVPPPHTEVNAGLVSWEAPKVQTVTGITYGGGSYVDIQFSKYVKVPLNIQAQAMTVTGPDNQEVEGTLAFVKPELNPADPAGLETLSPTLRFTPKNGSVLTVGSEYALKVKANILQSYAGVWMSEGHSGQFTVSLRDESGPVPTRATVDEGGMILSLTFNEPLGEAIDASKVELNGNAEAIASVVRSAAAGGNHTLLISLTEPLPAGDTTLKVLGGAVTDAAGNVSREYTLTVSRQAAGTDAGLSALSVAGGVLSPGFDPERLSYTVVVSQTAEEIQVTARTADSKAKLTVDGVEAVSGTAKSVRIPDNGEIAIRVTAEDGVTVREYTLTVSRHAAGTDAGLLALSVAGGVLSPGFDPGRLAYTVEVAPTAEDIQVTAQTADSKAKLTVDGVEAVSGTAKSVRIPDNGEIAIRVTAEDGVTVREYTLQVSRQAAGTDDGLSALSVAGGVLSPGFDPGRLAYTVEVAPTAEEIQVTARTADSKAKLAVDGVEAVSGTAKSVRIPDNGEIAIRVTAEDGVTFREYTLKVKRRSSEPEPSPSPGGGPSGPVETPSLTKTEKFISGSGGKGLLTTLRSDAISKALQNGADGQKLLKVEEGQDADEYVLRLTPDVLAELKKNRAGIVYNPGTLQVSLTGDVLGEVSLPAGASLNIAFAETSDEQTKSSADIADRQSGKSLKPIGNPVMIKLEVLREGKATSFEVPSDQAVRVELPYGAMGQQAVYGFDPSVGRWSYVQDQAAAKEPNRIVFDIRSSGHFAVMEYKNTFTDITGHWAAPDIGWMAQRLLVYGVTSESFHPNRAVTRAEFTSVLVRALDLPAAEPGKVTRFTDVGEAEWYYADVQSAVAAGIINGISKDRFDPNAPISREQMAVMIWRAYAYLHSTDVQDANLELLLKFEDSGKISGWAKEAVALSLQVGLVQGTSTHHFDPSGQATRGQMAAIVKRLLLNNPGQS